MSLREWTVEASIMDDGLVFLFHQGGNTEVPGTMKLKRMLFGWHKPSYYGTLIEPMTRYGQNGVRLTAAQAIDYFSDSPPVLRYGPTLHWGTQAREWMQTAGLLRTILQQGWFVPTGENASVNRGGRNACSFRVLRVDELHPDPVFAARCQEIGYPLLDGKLNEVMAALATGNGPVAEAWTKVVAAYPAAQQLTGAASRNRYTDEDELWEAVGFRTAVAPFAVGLQLMEPDTQAGQWHLLPWVYDRSRPELGVPYDWKGKPFTEEQVLPASIRQAEIREAIARQRAKWSQWLPELTEPWDTEQVWSFLSQGNALFIEKGVRILLPAWWEALPRKAPTVVAKLRNEAQVSELLGRDQLLAFDWKVAIDESELDWTAFQAAVKEKRKLLYVGGRWMVLHPRFLRALGSFFQKMGKRSSLTLAEVVELYLSGGHAVSVDAGEDGQPSASKQGQAATEALPELLWEVQVNSSISRWLADFEGKSRMSAIRLPQALEPVLRSYQAAGTRWLLSLRPIGFGACLADDMGLGKTLQFIAYLAALKEQGQLERPGLLVCPTSVLGNWQKEMERFAPNLTLYLHYGPRREQGEEFFRHITTVDLVITSYALTNVDEALLQEQQWSVVGLDEAQNIKNRQGKQSRAVRSFAADHRIALTGTPIENRLSELWTLFDFINPGYLGSYTSFHRQFGLLDKPSAGDANRRRAVAEQLQRLIRPFIMRRLKKDPSIQLDLPEKNENRIYIPLTLEQGALYEAELQHMLDQLDKLDALQRRGVILATLGRLKQICDHPALLTKEADGGEKGNKKTQQGPASHKLTRLVEMAGEVLAEGRKGLIFTQYIDMGKMLQAELAKELSCQVDFLHGGLSKETRERMVERFQQEQQGSDFLVVSLKAGGTGLNLTAATHVFHYDRWWNPAVEEQATDRAYRIGQTRDVQVHKFVALGTVEERIDEMLQRKLSLSSEIIGSGEQWVTELTTDELRDMFALRREWVRD